MTICIGLVFSFRESSRLAAAYGIAVTGTMAISSVLFYVVTRQIWNWPRIFSASLVACFLTVDLMFFTPNLTKVHEGGWIPLVLGIVIFSIMTTWKRGRELISQHMHSLALPLDDFLAIVEKEKPFRIKGTAVFMTLTRDIAPSVLLHHFRHNQSLHEKVILLSIVTKNEPDVDAMERVRVTELTHGFFKVIAQYGYMEKPDIGEILELCEGGGLVLDTKNLSFYLGRETILTTGETRFAQWRKRVFILLSRNARPATDFFGIPPNQVIEIGSQIRL
jgi:KUP system potassium uptake protein